MNKQYNKPYLILERFTLSDSIAAGCSQTVNLGPGDGTHSTCSDYPDIPVFFSGGESVTNFYTGVCGCYLNAAGGAMFTS